MAIKIISVQNIWLANRYLFGLQALWLVPYLKPNYLVSLKYQTIFFKAGS